MTRASVLIPTHDKHTTIGLAVDSVLPQTVGDLEVLLIGDGVTDALRAEIERLCAAAARVRDRSPSTIRSIFSWLYRKRTTA